MCRNIRPLFNYDPPVTEEEVRAAAAQFVRKISGFSKPSAANRAAVDKAFQIAVGCTNYSPNLSPLLSLVTAPPRRKTPGFQPPDVSGARLFTVYTP